jgi:hypothetical protein
MYVSSNDYFAIRAVYLFPMHFSGKLLKVFTVNESGDPPCLYFILSDSEQSGC